MKSENKEIIRRQQLLTRIKLLFIFQLAWLAAIVVAYIFISLGLPKLRLLSYGIALAFATLGCITLTKFFHERVASKFMISYDYKLLKVTEFLFSPKTQKEVFQPIAADWNEEYFEALFKQEIWKARWINVRYTYAFIVTMWQKSPIGDLIEFISKIAK